LKKPCGTTDVARPVIHNATTELWAADRREAHSEGLKHVNDLVCKMSRTKDVASQIQHHVRRMDRLGVLLNPWGLARGNHQLLEVPNLADVPGEIRTGHFDWASLFGIVNML
jgi:hypothetical protein